MPQPVIFDLYNTMIDGADSERDRALGDMADLLGVTPDDLLRVYRESWSERLVGWGVAETVRIMAGRLGVDPTPDQVEAATELRRSLPARLFGLVPDSVLAALDALRADGHPLGVISNATAESAEAWPDGPLAGRFDVVIFSSMVGLAKPDPAIYQLAAGKLGVETRECVFVGDGSDGELPGAEAVGMTVLRTVEFRDTVPGWPGPVISSIAELPGVLRALSSVQ